jgi:predicted metal-dependent HD superfamily phosphohydrolase
MTDKKQMLQLAESVFSGVGKMRQEDRDSLSEVLACMYATDYRKYHGIVHIVHIFDFQMKYKIELTLAQKIAILYHDVIYVPGFKENEELSAKFAVASLKPFVEHDVLDEASRIILDTKQHFSTSPFYMSKQSPLVLDLDISSMSLDYDSFLWWNRLIEEEFRPFGMTDNSKRVAFFEMFLSKANITQSEQMIWMEPAIRNNIERYIGHLKNVL